jgi:hypothetical protein
VLRQARLIILAHPGIPLDSRFRLFFAVHQG